jgi:hypothetical protein
LTARVDPLQIQSWERELEELRRLSFHAPPAFAAEIDVLAAELVAARAGLGVSPTRLARRFARARALADHLAEDPLGR